MHRQTLPPILLRGRVVQPDGTAPDRYLLIRDGRIAAISRRRPPRTEEVLYLPAGFQDWIFPGLLDLHTHASYNLLPLWDGPGFPYPNRFAWRRQDESYRLHIKSMMDYLQTPDPAHGGGGAAAAGAEAAQRQKAHQRALAAFSELQAVAGGTTTLQESRSLGQEAELAENVLCRGTADPADLGLAGGGSIYSPVDFFWPGADGRPEVARYKGKDGKPDFVPIEAYRQERDREEAPLLGTLLHLAEGRSGFGSDEGPDPYSRAELELFMRHEALADPAAVRRSPLALIHGCGIDVDDPRHLEFLRRREISVIWSPVSNLLLYGQTLDVEKLVAAGVNVALGSDWSPSGSKHVWEEAKLARFYFEALGSPVSDAQVFQMVTTNAARCLRAESLGRLVEGAFADLFILRSPLESDNPLEVFFKTTDRDVRAVFVGGVPLYGARDYLEGFQQAPFRLHLQKLPEREGSSVVDKVVHLPPELTNEDGEPLDVDRDITHLEDLMKHPPEPLPPTLRSNLLASSDSPYRQRMTHLRRQVLDYGWQVQRWRKGKEVEVDGLGG